MDFSKIAKLKIEQARAELEVPLDPNDPSLSEQLMLGDDWNDPAVVTNAVDGHPMFYARWNTLLRHLKREYKVASELYDVWESAKKEKLAKDIFDENILNGMTPNNARPPASQVVDRFNNKYKDSKSSGHKYYIKYHFRVEELERQIDIAEVIVKAFEHRKDLLLSFMGFIRFQYENNLVKIKRSENKKTDGRSTMRSFNP